MLNRQRARSEDEKFEREDTILAAAETLLRQSRYDAFTMQKVAKAAGLAKGTLYLYFKSRETLVLGVYERLFDRWIDQLASFKPKLTGIDALCQDFACHYADDRLFAQLAALAPMLLESKMELDVYIKNKRALAQRVKRLAGIICHYLEISPVESQKLVWRLLTIAAGASQITVQPVGIENDLPEDVKLFLSSVNFEIVFFNASVPLRAVITSD